MTINPQSHEAFHDAQHASAFATREEHRTAEKALRLNLDRAAYGTFAEIGGGQEVARWFFRVGGAAGTVAKSMSAYDMQFSDAIYGKGTRYVSSERMRAMLSHEYSLLNERLKASRGDQTRFFVFANTVSVRNFEGTNECHGWVGLRFQADPLGLPNDILLHVDLRDTTNLLQQQALGTLGVNMIYGAMYERNSLDQLLKGIFESLSLSRVEIDFLRVSGPEFEGLEVSQVSIALLRNSLCHAVAFDAHNQAITPSELLHHRPLVLQRGSFSRATEKFQQMMRDSELALAKELGTSARAPISVFEISTNSARPDDVPDDKEVLRRTAALTALGYPVLLTNFIENFRLSEYLRRYTQEPIRFSVGIGTLAQVLRKSFYTEVEGGLLEGLGKLLVQKVKVYAFPMTQQEFANQLRIYGATEEFCAAPDSGLVTAENVTFFGPVRHLYTYLLMAGSIVPMCAKEE